MIFAIELDGGGVSIMTLLPTHIRSEGATIPVDRISDGTLWAGGHHIAVGMDVASLDENSVAGISLIFPNVDDEIAKWPDNRRALVKDAHAIDVTNIPPDRDYRDAWLYKGGTIIHDMTKAREIHRDKMRAARVPLFDALDIDYVRADERSDVKAKAKIAAQKQLLRDVTDHPDIEAAATLEALKAVWPELLAPRLAAKV